jgi:cytoskeletal protein RodZ
MSVFIGNQLRRAREAQELTLEQVAESTHIRIHYLQAMEAGDFDSFPSQAQARGFLRGYADHLKLEAKPLLDILEKGDAPPTLPLDETLDLGIVSNEDAEEAESEEDKQPKLVSAGETLRKQREILGLSLEDVERHTHLKTKYLQAIEDGDLEALPSMAQGSGMLKNYADFLSLDPEPMLLHFADTLQSRLEKQRTQSERRQTQPQRQPREVSLLRRLLSRDMLIGGAIVLFLIVFAILVGMQIATARSVEEEPVPTPPSIADVLLPSPSASLEPTATVTVPSPLEEVADADPGEVNELNATPDPFALDEVDASPIQVQVLGRQRAYMRVTVDGKVEFDGRVIPGAAHAFSGSETIEVLTGNAAGVQLIYNGEDLGTMGVFGQVVNTIFTPSGIQYPTPTITLTPTNTPRTTATPTVTPTIVP